MLLRKLRLKRAQGSAGKIEVTWEDSELTAIQIIIRGAQSRTLFKDIKESACNTAN